MQLSFFREERNKYTSRKKFYEEVNGILPITEWVESISSYYYKNEESSGTKQKRKCRRS